MISLFILPVTSQDGCDHNWFSQSCLPASLISALPAHMVDMNRDLSWWWGFLLLVVYDSAHLVYLCQLLLFFSAQQLKGITLIGRFQIKSRCNAVSVLDMDLAKQPSNSLTDVTVMNKTIASFHKYLRYCCRRVFSVPIAMIQMRFHFANVVLQRALPKLAYLSMSFIFELACTG